MQGGWGHTPPGVAPEAAAAGQRGSPRRRGCRSPGEAAVAGDAAVGNGGRDAAAAGRESAGGDAAEGSDCRIQSPQC